MRNSKKAINERVKILEAMGLECCSSDSHMMHPEFYVQFDFSAIDVSKPENILYQIIKTSLAYGEKKGKEQIQEKFKELLDI